jgi:hypothetical protein
MVILIMALIFVWNGLKGQLENLFTNVIGERLLRRTLFDPRRMYQFNLGR